MGGAGLGNDRIVGINLVLAHDRARSAIFAHALRHVQKGIDRSVN